MFLVVQLALLLKVLLSHQVLLIPETLFSLPEGVFEICDPALSLLTLELPKPLLLDQRL